MRVRHSAFQLGMMALVLAALVPAARAAEITEGNSLEVRQFRIDHARLPGQLSVRQSVLAWQVTQGTWNGQALDGLSLVFVKSTSEDGRSSTYTNCYISHEASMAQRQALLAAFVSSQAGSGSGEGAIGTRDLQSMRFEPAVITLEMDGGTVVLHLGLVG